MNETTETDHYDVDVEILRLLGVNATLAAQLEHLSDPGNPAHPETSKAENPENPKPMNIPNTEENSVVLQPMKVEGRYLLRNVKVNWPQLFEARADAEGDYYKCGMQVMLSRKSDEAVIERLQSIVRELAAARNDKKDSDGRGKMLPSDKVFLSDGDDKEDETYHGHVWFHCNAPWERAKVDGRRYPQLPRVLDYFDPKKRVTDPLQEPRIYSGCRMNVLFDIYYWHSTDPKIGRQINCTLISCQFAGHGTPLSAGHVTEEAAEEGFEGHEMVASDEGFGEAADTGENPGGKPRSASSEFDDDIPF